MGGVPGGYTGYGIWIASSRRGEGRPQRKHSIPANGRIICGDENVNMWPQDGPSVWKANKTKPNIFVMYGEKEALTTLR